MSFKHHLRPTVSIFALFALLLVCFFTGNPLRVISRQSFSVPLKHSDPGLIDIDVQSLNHSDELRVEHTGPGLTDGGSSDDKSGEGELNTGNSDDDAGVDAVDEGVVDTEQTNKVDAGGNETVVDEKRKQIHDEDSIESDDELPPRLAPSLSHIAHPPNLTEPYDWKRPAMMTALGIPQDDKLKLAVITSGVDLIGFNRAFHFLGCLVGNKTYPRLVKDQRIPHFCLVDKDIPTGAHISVLLRRDEKIVEALEKPLVFGEFIIENKEEDFLKLDDGVVVDDKVRELAGDYEIVTIKSKVKWHEGMREREFDSSKKRFELCLMTAMRQYPFLMQEWFDYYRQVGVDQIYVYDNVATEDLSKFDSDFVQTAFWPFARSQQQSFNHFLLLSKNRCKYVGFFDADEYAFVGGDSPKPMKAYVQKRMKQGYDQVLFPFIVMAGNGYVERPEGFLPELYPRRSLRQKKFHVGKTVLLTDARWVRHGVHGANGGKKYYKNTTFELNPTSLDHNAMLVHYTVRSWEEFIMKTNVGGASIMTNARAPQNKTIESIPNHHLSNDSTEEFLTFRNRWRSIMEQPAPKQVVLTWRKGEKDCVQEQCIECNKTEPAEVTCS